MSNLSWHDYADIVVIGTGVAGLTAALTASRSGHQVVVLTKAPPQAASTATSYAQGGIAVVIPGTDDCIDDHVADTLQAGADLCDPAATESIIADGYRAVCNLVNLGARFDHNTSQHWELTQEGGHRRRRIIHAGGDATGAEVQRTLNHASQSLDIRYNHTALQLLTHDDVITGIHIASPTGTGIIHTSTVILATGGLGHIYPATTNPPIATGDGTALALWAGATAENIEFIQFHPTMLFTHLPGAHRPLISEAVRGEGAILVDQAGCSIMDKIHPMGDLAPRDIVAGAIHRRLIQRGDSYAYLDTHAITNFSERFPTITKLCHASGINPDHQRIPVVPGAHYSCGGIRTDHEGFTGINGLFAVGEIACTGLHGANRLASNSLLEGLVMGQRAGTAATLYAHRVPHQNTPDSLDPLIRPILPRDELQHAMFLDGFVIRDRVGLMRLIALIQQAPPTLIHTQRDLEDAALTLTAYMIATAGLARTETRGCHTRSDHPHSDLHQQHSQKFRYNLDTTTVIPQ